LWKPPRTPLLHTFARIPTATGELYELAWPEKALESIDRLRSNIFEVSVLFERAHAHEPAHIHSTALACCAQCTSCEAIVCARSVSVDSAAMETIGVISMAAVLALGPGPKMRSGTYKPKKYVLISLNNSHSSFNFFDL